MTNTSWTTLGHGAKVDGRPCINNRVASHAPALEFVAERRKELVISHGPIRSRDMAQMESASGYLRKTVRGHYPFTAKSDTLETIWGQFPVTKNAENRPLLRAGRMLMQKFPSRKSEKSWVFCVACRQLCRHGEKKSKKVPKKVDKKSPFRYTVLARNANAFHFIQSLLSVEACPPDAQLV